MPYWVVSENLLMFEEMDLLLAKMKNSMFISIHENMIPWYEFPSPVFWRKILWSFSFMVSWFHHWNLISSFCLSVFLSICNLKTSFFSCQVPFENLMLVKFFFCFVSVCLSVPLIVCLFICLVMMLKIISGVPKYSCVT